MVLASLVKLLEKAMEEVKPYQWECCFEVYVFSKQCGSEGGPGQQGIVMVYYE